MVFCLSANKPDTTCCFYITIKFCLHKRKLLGFDNYLWPKSCQLNRTWSPYNNFYVQHNTKTFLIQFTFMDLYETIHEYNMSNSGFGPREQFMVKSY